MNRKLLARIAAVIMAISMITGTYSTPLTAHAAAVTTDGWTSAKCEDTDYRYSVWEGHTVRYMDFNLASYNNRNYLINDYIVMDEEFHYYTAEAASPEGKVVQSLQIGDTFTVDGITYVIDGEVYSNYKTDSCNNLWKRAGYNTCIQTCVPPYNGAIVVKYGHALQNNSK